MYDLQAAGKTVHFLRALLAEALANHQPIQQAEKKLNPTTTAPVWHIAHDAVRYEYATRGLGRWGYVDGRAGSLRGPGPSGFILVATSTKKSSSSYIVVSSQQRDRNRHMNDLWGWQQLPQASSRVRHCLTGKLCVPHAPRPQNAVLLLSSTSTVQALSPEVFARYARCDSAPQTLSARESCRGRLCILLSVVIRISQVCRIAIILRGTPASHPPPSCAASCALPVRASLQRDLNCSATLLAFTR